MKVDFNTMTKMEALAYCYKHENEYKRDAYGAGEDGVKMFDCLTSILLEGRIQPNQLPEYGMDYETEGG